MSTHAASSPAACAHAGATAADHIPPGPCVSHARPAHSRCTTHAPSDHSGAASTPSSASGVTTSVTSGIATRLAAKPTSDTCWKHTSESGARPSVATTCPRSSPRRRSNSRAARPGGTGGGARRTSPDASSSPTAANDSQNPACSSAHGSSAVTTTAAASQTSGQGHRLPHACSAVTAASIHTVRCAGTPQPEKTA